MNKKSPIGKDGAVVNSQSDYTSLPDKTQQNNELLTAALALAQRGKYVFPLVPRGKKPLTAYGLKDGTIDQGRILHWWTDTPDANIGLVTGSISGVFVLDIDNEASLKDLERQHGQLPPTVEVITGGGGRHLYFLWPAQGGISNSVCKLGAGLDIRGNGGYVVAPPSIHESGKRYAWSVDTADKPSPAPKWLLDLINKPAESKVTSAAEWRTLVKGVAEGSRNDTLSRIAGKLLRSRIDPFMVLELCHCWNECRCSPPLPAEEVTQTVNSIAGRELARRGA